MSSPLRDVAGATLLIFPLLFVPQGAGCAPPPQPPSAPAPPPPSADDFLAAGDYGRARAAYLREERASRSPSDVARARFFRALVRLAQRDAALAQEELRSLAAREPADMWTRLARVLSDELARTTVLREELRDAGAELHLLRLRIQILEEVLEESQQEATQRQEEIDAMKEDRLRLQAALRDAEERAADNARQVRELEEALDALKRIDMQREP